METFKCIGYGFQPGSAFLDAERTTVTMTYFYTCVGSQGSVFTEFVLVDFAFGAVKAVIELAVKDAITAQMLNVHEQTVAANDIQLL